MNRLRLFFVKFRESNEEVCTIVSHGSIMNILSIMILQTPLEKSWPMHMSPCGISNHSMLNIGMQIIPLGRWKKNKPE